MAITPLGKIVFIPEFDSQINGSSAVFTYDTSTDSLQTIFQIPGTGTIANVHCRIGTNTSPVMTHRCELRTVDTSTGKANAAGTLYGSSTSCTAAASGYSNNTNVTFPVNATGAAAGELAALVLDLSAFTSGSFTMIQRYAGSIGDPRNFPYQVSNTSGSDTLGILTFNAFALEYGSGVYYRMPWDSVTCSVAATSTVTNSGVTRRGNRYRPEVPYRVIGFKIWGDLDGDCFLRLRKQSDDSVLATATFDKDVRGSTGTNCHTVVVDAGATVNLVAGTDYYILVEGNSATTDSIYSISNIPAQAQLDQLSGGQNCYGTSYNSGYTDVTTQRYAIGLMVDGVDLGGGTSGGGMRLAGHGGLAA